MSKIDKRDFVTLIHKRINKSVSSKLITAVFDFLIAIIVKDLLTGKEIKIPNFGKFVLKDRKKSYTVKRYDGKLVQSKGKKRLKIFLSKRIKNFLVKNINLDKTFENI